MSDDVPRDDEELAEDAAFRAVFGERLSDTLNLDTWSDGLDLEKVMARLREEVASAVEKEGRVRNVIRNEILPRLGKPRPGAPDEAGVYRARPDELAAIHEGLLFPGRVAAVGGTSVSHDSLPIGITQVGIAVVSYGGACGTFSQRLYRREMTSRNTDALKEAMELIDMRQNRYGGSQMDNLSKLACRGIKAHAERAILVEEVEAEWRIGQGNPCAYELLSGSGYMDLLDSSLAVLRKLIQGHKKFVFVPGALEERGLLTIGYALSACEYAILSTLERHGEHIINGWRYGDTSRNKALDFVKDCCPEVLVGLFRVSERSPPRLFYAHRENVHLAARVAMADSILRPERGFPMLLDVADVTSRGAFGADGFLGLVQDAYTHAGANLQYLNESKKRR